MKKPLAVALAVSTALLALPPSWADDPPALTQLTTMLQGDGWKFDTDKKVFTKGDKTLYVQGDGTVSPNPPTLTQQKPPEPGKSKGLNVKEPASPDDETADPHVVHKTEKKPGFFKELGTNRMTWVFGGGLLGAVVLGLLGGPIGVLVGGLAGMLAGNFLHDKFLGKDK
jgi:hypothetical protein